MEYHQHAQDSSIRNPNINPDVYEHRQHHGATYNIDSLRPQHQSQSQSIYNQRTQHESQQGYSVRHSPATGACEDEENDTDGEGDKCNGEQGISEDDGIEMDCDDDLNDDISTYNADAPADGDFTYPHPLHVDEEFANPNDPRLMPGGEMDLAGGFDFGFDDNQAEGFYESQLPSGEFSSMFRRHIIMFTLFLGFDEQSPSEDELEAEAALRDNSHDNVN